MTGQQVGLFSGPAYTIYKALTAAKLAAQLSAAGTPAVPVFWLATEDHDFAEVSHAWAFDEANRPVQFEVNGQSENNTSRRIDRDSTVARRRVPAISSQAFHSAMTFAALVEETYRPGASMGQAFHACWNGC